MHPRYPYADACPRRVLDVWGASLTPSSSSGLGRRPFKAVARVRIPLGARSWYHQGPVAQLVSAPPCHGGGRGFESRRGRQGAPKGALPVLTPRAFGSIRPFRPCPATTGEGRQRR